MAATLGERAVDLLVAANEKLVQDAPNEEGARLLTDPGEHDRPRQ
jgi:hypothetical protein